MIEPHGQTYRPTPGFTVEILPVFNWRIPVSFTLEFQADYAGFIFQLQLFGIGIAADGQLISPPCRCYQCKKEKA